MILELDLKNARHRELKRLMLASNSIGQASAALSSLDGLAKEKHRVLLPHVMTAAIICYARPFVGTRTAGRISKKWEQFDDATQQTLHRRVLRLRAKVVAHSDDDMTHVRIIDKNLMWTFTPEDGGKPFSMVHPHFTSVILTRDSLTDTVRFSALCDVQVARIEEAASAMRELLRAEMTNRGEIELMDW